MGAAEDAALLAFAVSPEPDAFGTGTALPPARLRVVLGGFARDPDSAEATLRALAEQGPSLLLPGGEDSTAAMDEALARLESNSLVDLRGVSEVRYQGVSFVVVVGAPDGRYGRGDDACGFSANDLKQIAGRLSDAPQRALLSWAMPSASPDDKSGSALGELAESAGAQSGLYAWPRRNPEPAGPWHGVPLWTRGVETSAGGWTLPGALRFEKLSLPLAPVRMGRPTRRTTGS